MLYVFYGPDDFSVQEKFSRVKESVVGDDVFETNITKFHVSSTSPKQIEEICNTIPFLGSKRMVVVEGLLSIFERNNSPGSQGKERKESLSGWIDIIGYLKTLPDTTDLVLLDGKIGRGNRFLDGIRSFGQIKEFTPLVGDNLKNWIQERVSKSGSSMSTEATQLLANLVGNNLWVLNNEIEKLSLYCTNRVVESEDVLKLVAFSREMTVFNAIDALFDNRDSEFLRIIQQMIEKDSTGPYLITMLSRQVRLLLIAKELVEDKVNKSDIPKRLSVQQWLADRLIRVSNRYSQEVLINLHKSLLQCDIGIKKGLISEESIGKVVLEVMGLTRHKSAGNE